MGRTYRNTMSKRILSRCFVVCLILADIPLYPAISALPQQLDSLSQSTTSFSCSHYKLTLFWACIYINTLVENITLPFLSSYVRLGWGSGLCRGGRSVDLQLCDICCDTGWLISAAARGCVKSEIVRMVWLWNYASRLSLASVWNKMRIDRQSDSLLFACLGGGGALPRSYPKPLYLAPF